MTRDEIRKRLLDILTRVQRDSDAPCPPLTDDTVPLRDLPGFDSLSCTDAEDRLSTELGVDVDSIPFKSSKRGHEQTIKEIVDFLCREYAIGGSQ